MTVVEGVPCGGVLRRRLIGGAKHEPRQLFTVVRHGHDLKLPRACFVAGEKVDRIVQLTVGFTVPNQFSVFLFVAHLQFLKDALVACTGKAKGALRIFSAV